MVSRSKRKLQPSSGLLLLNDYLLAWSRVRTLAYTVSINMLKTLAWFLYGRVEFLKNKEREKGVLRVLIFDMGVDELF
jgi:hypothetical protein